MALLMVPAQAKENTVRHAIGTFEVKITPEAEGAAPANGMPTGRMGLHKTFTGGMAGTAVGTMLTAGVPDRSLTYVAIDQFDGTVDGRPGGFVLAHRGTMTPAGEGTLSIEISPNSGTGQLSGIAGRLDIQIKDKVHHYDLAYTLPAED